MWLFCLWLQSVLYFSGWPILQDVYCYLSKGPGDLCNETINQCPNCSNFFSSLFLYPLILLLYGYLLFFWPYLIGYILIDNVLNKGRSNYYGFIISQCWMLLFLILLFILSQYLKLDSASQFNINQIFVIFLEFLEDSMFLIIGNALFMLFFVPFRYKYLMPSRE